MSDHSWLEQTAPYALGALDEQEQALFEAHLATCDVCASEVRELREVAGLLATAAPHTAPPAGLRDRILVDARNVRPIGTGAPSGSAGALASNSRPAAPSGSRVTAGADRARPGGLQLDRLQRLSQCRQQRQQLRRQVVRHPRFAGPAPQARHAALHDEEQDHRRSASDD